MRATRAVRIDTKFNEPTQRTGSTISVAFNNKHKKVYNWSHNLDVADNHKLAAEKLMQELRVEASSEIMCVESKVGYTFSFAPKFNTETL